MMIREGNFTSVRARRANDEDCVRSLLEHFTNQVAIFKRMENFEWRHMFAKCSCVGYDHG